MLQIGYFHDNSTNHGDGNHLTYVVRGLQPLTHYELVVAVESPGDTSPPSHTSRNDSGVPIGYMSYTNTVTFTTKGEYLVNLILYFIFLICYNIL